MRKIAMVFFLVSGVIFGMTAYDIEKLDIVTDIQTNGSIKIQEKILYNIDDVDGIFYNIDTLGYGKLKDLEIYYKDKVDDNFKKAIPSTYLERGNYTVAERNGFYKIKLYAPARKEQKEFIFKYTLTDGIKVFKDIAQLKKKMVGMAWDEPIKHIKIIINLPREVSKDEIYAFGHGPLHGNVEVINGKQVIYSIDNYYPGKFLETNLLFPTRVINEITPNKIISKDVLDKILKIEKKLAEKVNITKQKAMTQLRIGKLLFGIGIIWWIGVVIYIYIRNSRRHRIKNEYEEYFREIPDDYSPAMAGLLVSRKNYPSSRELIASILDLVRKNKLKLIEENGKIILESTGEDVETLRNYEKFLYRWYITGLGDGKKVVLEDINKAIKNKSSAHIYNYNFEKWQTMVYTDMLSQNLRNDKKDKVSTVIGVITGIIFFIIGMPLNEYFNNEIFIIWVVLGVALFPYILSRRRYSFEKEEAYMRWEAFKNFVANYSDLEEAKLASVKLWEDYFVYAVALGIAEKVAKGYEKIMIQKGKALEKLKRTDNTLMGLYLYSGMLNYLNKNTEKAIKTSFDSVEKNNINS